MKTLVIHNPVAGKGRHDSLLKPFATNGVDIIQTQSPNDATKIVQHHLGNYDLFIAAGGDGTVNEVAKALIDTGKNMAILPMGSGNGLVNEVGRISASALNGDKLQKLRMDTLEINSIPFLNVAGIGFEASVAEEFSRKKARGFLTYISVTIAEFLKFRPITVDYSCDQVNYSNVIFSLTVANSKQYGNNAVISPKSITNDGIFEVCTIKKFPGFYGGVLAYRLLNGTIDNSKYYSSLRCTSFELNTTAEMLWNLDGEPIYLKGPFSITIKPSSLNILFDAN